MSEQTAPSTDPSLSQAVNAPHTFELGNLTITVAEPSISMVADWEQWGKSEIYANAVVFAQLLPTENKNAVLQEAMRMSSLFAFDSPLGQTLLRTPRGIAKLLSLCSKKPDGKSPTLQEIMVNVTSFLRTKQISSAMGLDAADPTEVAAKAGTTNPSTGSRSSPTDSLDSVFPRTNLDGSPLGNSSMQSNQIPTEKKAETTV